MSLLPGWDRARLRIADPDDVARARWHVFAGALEETATEPYAAELRRAEIEALKGPSRERAAERFERERRVGLKKLVAQQASVRRLLLLDDPDGAPRDLD